MTYEPGRDPQEPLDVHPEERRSVASRSGMPGVAVILGIIALAIIGALLFYTPADRATVATDTRPTATTPNTTGTGTTNPATQRETTGAPVQRPMAPAPAPK